MRETGRDGALVAGPVGGSSDTNLFVQQLRAVVAELFMALSSMLDDERDSARQYLSRAAEILQEIERSHAVVGRQIQGGLAPWQARKVKAHIEVHIGRPIRSRDLAAILRMDPCHFSRAFRNSFGNSPIDYLIRRRMERAKELMLSTDAPLSAIALECGLADQAHFSRLFRRIVGESPRAWRRARVAANSGRLLAESLRVCSFTPRDAVESCKASDSVDADLTSIQVNSSFSYTRKFQEPL